MSTPNPHSSKDAKPRKFEPKLVKKRALRSGIFIQRPLEHNPLPLSKLGEKKTQYLKQWLVNDQTQGHLNNIIRDVKAIGNLLGKIVNTENFVQVLANFLYEAQSELNKPPALQKSRPPLPKTLPPQSTIPCSPSTVSGETENGFEKLPTKKNAIY